jgi:thioredoxin 1
MIVAIELNRDNFEAEVLESKQNFLVDFWGPQCIPCLALNPAVERLEAKYGDRIKVGKVNAIGNRMLCAKQRVLGLPTFIIYKAGEEVKRLTGETITEAALIEAVESALK